MKPRARRRRLFATTFFAAPALAALVALVALPLLAPPPSADACGPYFPQPAFWPEGSTGVDWERMVGGELGILDRGVDVRELYVAYRHLAGPPLSAADRETLVGFDAPRDDLGGYPEQRGWLQARRELTSIEPDAPFFLDASRTEIRELPDGGTLRRYVLNCLNDAFDHAAETLDARVATYGADSREVAEWVRGQDQVFANCSEGHTIPEPLDDSWPEALRDDREYQIAAAHFYALDYAEAERRFRAIGDDETSEWRHLARYLVARTQARDRRREEAVETLRELADDPAQGERRDSIRGLIDHYRAQSKPAELHAEKARALLASPLPASARQDWIDFAATLFAGGASGLEVDRWIAAFVLPLPHAATVERTDALAVWRHADPSRHWLVAALVVARPEDGSDPASLDDLLAAAATVDPEAPEAATVAFHRARLLLALGRDAEAVAALDGLLADGDLPLATRNRVQAMRADHAESLDDYLRWSQMTPAALTLDGMYWPPSNDEPLPVLLSEDAARLVDAMTTGELAELVAGEVLEAGVRRRVVGAAWTRAVLLDDAATAERLAPLVARLVPELAPEMERYLAAGDDERRFVAALALLRNPGLEPSIGGGLPRDEPYSELDAYRRNWWCPGPSGWFEGELAPPPFFTADVRTVETRAEQRAAMDGLASGPILLGDRAINRADRHRDDPRVPEALHRTVRATRYGCTYYDEDVEAVSKDAWTRLHRRYPQSEWTERTPYWFD
jgi:hypothetical protein